jgi:hypothetical protein
MKKIIGISLMVLLFVSVSAIITLHLFTKEKVEVMAKNASGFAFYSEETAFDLGALLGFNMSIIGEEYVKFENDQLINEWRNMLANDPSLAYTSFDLYSPTFVTAFKKEFENHKVNMIASLKETKSNENDELIKIYSAKSATDFLRKSLEKMDKYQNLIDELLKLDDNRLNSFISSVPKDACCSYENQIEATEFKKWLLEKNIISINDVESPSLPWVSIYPTDLLLLSFRVSSSYPTWTNRRFLQEVKKFSVHVEENFKY